MTSKFTICLAALLSLVPSSLSTPVQPAEDIILPASVPQKIKITDKPSDPNGKMVKMRYGPFTVPANSMFAPLPSMAGGVKIEKPCEECYLGKFQGGMEYEDGSEANVDTGMYMHHFVITNTGKPDWLCGLRKGGSFRNQWVYNSGNERPPVRLNSKYKFGMRIDKEDTFETVAELMNMSNETRTVYTTVLYEVVPLDTPGYREATHLRLEVWQCGGSDVPAKKGAYTYTSPNWTSPYSGVILHNDGHGHDGTVNVKLHINDKVYCDSIQYYGLRPTWTQPHHIAVQHGDSMTEGMQYISDTVMCEDEGRLEKGDVLKTEAFYNGTKYPQMVFRGHLEGQMGINFLYIGRDEHTLKDKLPMDSRIDQMPVEMNLTSVFGKIGSIIPGLSSTPETPEPEWVEAPPYKPLKRPAGMFDLSTMIPGFPKMSEMSTTLPSKLDDLLATFLPGLLPANFKLSKVFVPGGIVVSEMQELMHALAKKRGSKGTGPWGLGRADHFAVSRAALQLAVENGA